MTSILAFFQNPMNWLKAIAGVIAVAAIVASAMYCRYIYDQAQLVPALQAQHAADVAQHSVDEAAAAKAAIDLMKAQVQRDQAVNEFNKWQDLKTSLDNSLEGMIRNASVSKNPTCSPTTADRKLWNDSITSLTK